MLTDDPPSVNDELDDVVEEHDALSVNYELDDVVEAPFLSAPSDVVLVFRSEYTALATMATVSSFARDTKE